MIEHVKKVLADPKRVFPGYDAGAGYEISRASSGLQGFNDMVDGHVYPSARQSRTASTLYSEWLAHFIRDVRRDVGAPKMPFVIGVMGVGGMDDSADKDTIRVSQGDGGSGGDGRNFKGNVLAVETAPFWSEELGAIDEKRGAGATRCVTSSIPSTRTTRTPTAR